MAALAESARTEELVMGLHERGDVLKFGASLIMKSGLWTPWLVNMRPVLSFDKRNMMPEERQLTIRDMLLDGYDEKLKQLDFDHVYGAPEAGTPLTTAVAINSGVSLLWERVVAKQRGAHQMLEGVYYDGEVVAQIDDVVTRADTKNEANEMLAASGLVCRDVVVGVDRQQGGAEVLAAQGVQLHAVLDATTIFDVLHANGELTDGERTYLDEYVHGPDLYEAPADYSWGDL